MNKYHNRNRIISPIMTIHDILTLHILSSFLPLFLSSLPLLSFLSFFPPSLYSLSLLSSLSLPSLFSLPFLFLFLFLFLFFFPFSPSLFSSLLSLPFLLSSLLLSLSVFYVFSVFYR